MNENKEKKNEKFIFTNKQFILMNMLNKTTQKRLNALFVWLYIVWENYVVPPYIVNSNSLLNPRWLLFSHFRSSNFPFHCSLAFFSQHTSICRIFYVIFIFVLLLLFCFFVEILFCFRNEKEREREKGKREKCLLFFFLLLFLFNNSSLISPDFNLIE